MLGSSIAHVFSRLAAELNILISFERMRWTYAQRLYSKLPNDKTRLKTLQQLLGHKELSTTKAYFHRHQSDEG